MVSMLQFTQEPWTFPTNLGTWLQVDVEAMRIANTCPVKNASINPASQRKCIPNMFDRTKQPRTLWWHVKKYQFTQISPTLFEHDNWHTHPRLSTFRACFEPNSSRLSARSLFTSDRWKALAHGGGLRVFFGAQNYQLSVNWWFGARWFGILKCASK